MRTFLKISMAVIGVIGVTMIYLSFTRFAYEYVIGPTLFGVGLILLVILLGVTIASLGISSHGLEIIKRIAKKLALVGVILAILIFGQWLIFASVDSPHGSVPLGSTVRLPLFGTVVHYDKMDEIKVKRSFFSKEITIDYTHRRSSNDAKAIGLSLFGNHVAVRTHWWSNGQVDTFDTTTGREISSKFESGWNHGPLYIFW